MQKTQLEDNLIWLLGTLEPTQEFLAKLRDIAKPSWQVRQARISEEKGHLMRRHRDISQRVNVIEA